MVFDTSEAAMRRLIYECIYNPLTLAQITTVGKSHCIINFGHSQSPFLQEDGEYRLKPPPLAHSGKSKLFRNFTALRAAKEKAAHADGNSEKSFILAERGGFEPPIRCRIHDFESCAFNHSATSPIKSIIPEVYTRGMEDSVITKIIKGEIPAHKVYEDEKTLAFLDIFPKNEGHTLVIPKVNPAEFVWDLDDDTYQALMATARKVALHLREILPYAYVHEAVVGTDVPYAHIHIIPFNTTAQLHNPQRTDLEPDHAALAALAEKLRFDD